MDFARAVQAGEFVVQNARQQHVSVRLQVSLPKWGDLAASLPIDFGLNHDANVGSFASLKQRFFEEEGREAGTKAPLGLSLPEDVVRRFLLAELSLSEVSVSKTGSNLDQHAAAMSFFEARLLHVLPREISAGISEEAEVPNDSAWSGEFALAFWAALVLNVLDKRDLVCRCETAVNILKSS